MQDYFYPGKHLKHTRNKINYTRGHNRQPGKYINQPFNNDKSSRDHQVAPSGNMNKRSGQRRKEVYHNPEDDNSTGDSPADGGPYTTFDLPRYTNEQLGAITEQITMMLVILNARLVSQFKGVKLFSSSLIKATDAKVVQGMRNELEKLNKLMFDTMGEIRVWENYEQEIRNAIGGVKEATGTRSGTACKHC